MNQITGLLANKRIFGSVILLLGVLFFTYTIQETSQKLKKITGLESGVQTCFSRVNQTYTAKLLGEQSSQYLTQNFQSLTEECFAEGILNVEENLKLDLPVLAKKLSTLASNVHWFHEDSLLPISNNVSAPVAVRSVSVGTEERNIGSRFETIETTKDEILEIAEQFNSTLSNRLGQTKNYFYFTSFILMILLVLEYISNANKKLSNSAREMEAIEELSVKGGIESVKFSEIICIALEQNDLKNCAKLFHNYYAFRTNIHNEKMQNKEVMALENLVAPSRFVSSSAKEQIEEIWKDDKLGLELDQVPVKLKSFNLNLMNAKMINLLAEKIFSAGVHFNVSIGEQITIKGKEEELEQIFYSLISNTLSVCKNSSPVNLSAHRLGDIVILDLAFHSNGSDIFLSEIDTEICETLLHEINAKLKVDNTLDQLGNVNGFKVKVIFIAGLDESQIQIQEKEKEKENVNHIAAI
jgi:signal transduction histidine kinase